MDSRTPKEHHYPIMEIFGPTIQGEGVLCGTPTHFIRFGGCGYRCTWCDTMYAVDPAQVKANRVMMTSEEIVTEVLKLPSVPYITLSGGDPCLHDLLPVLQLFRRTLAKQYRPMMKFAIETQGELYPEWLRSVEVVTVSPKPPSSGMKPKLSIIERMACDLAKTMVLKFAVQDNTDLEWVLDNFIRNSVYDRTPVYIQPVTPQPAVGYDELVKGLRWLTEVCLEHPKELLSRTYGFKIIPQMHRLMFKEERGV